MPIIIQTIFFFHEKCCKNSNCLDTEKFSLGKKVSHTASVLLHLTDEKTEGKGLSVTRKSARVRLLLGLQTPSCHA